MSAMNIDLFPTDDCPSSLSFTLLVITQCVFKNKLVFDYTSFIPREKLFNQKEFVHNESYFTQNLPVSFLFFKVTIENSVNLDNFGTTNLTKLIFFSLIKFHYLVEWSQVLNILHNFYFVILERNI